MKRGLTVIKFEIDLEIHSKFPDWNLVKRLAEEALYIEDNRDYSYDPKDNENENE